MITGDVLEFENVKSGSYGARVKNSTHFPLAHSLNRPGSPAKLKCPWNKTKWGREGACIKAIVRCNSSYHCIRELYVLKYALVMYDWYHVLFIMKLQRYFPFLFSADGGGRVFGYLLYFRFFSYICHFSTLHPSWFRVMPHMTVNYCIFCQRILGRAIISRGMTNSLAVMGTTFSPVWLGRLWPVLRSLEGGAEARAIIRKL